MKTDMPKEILNAILIDCREYEANAELDRVEYAETNADGTWKHVLGRNSGEKLVAYVTYTYEADGDVWEILYGVGECGNWSLFAS